MPTYEYRCTECDERFERKTTIALADDVRCDLGHHDVKRLLSSFAVAGEGAAPAASGGGGCCGGACGCG